jgi:rhamnosyltransferase
MIAAIVTTYKPDAAFVSRFQPLLKVCSAVIVSDNTPQGHFDEGALPQGFTLLASGGNVGIGRALNNGIAGAKQLGAGYVVLFDQDSTPSVDLVRNLQASLLRAQAVHGPRICIGPTHVDDATGHEQKGLRARPLVGGDGVVQEDIVGATCLATSGMTLDISALEAEDTFSTELFLDLVDFEWCWRLGAKGWRFARIDSVQMKHRLGVAERRWMGLRFHVPAPYRHYFQFRDTLRLLTRSYVPLYPKLRLAGVLPFKLLVYPFLLDRGAERLRWMLRGIIDAFAQTSGIGAAESRLGR